MFTGDPDLELRLYGEEYEHFYEKGDLDPYDQFIFCGRKCKKRRHKIAAVSKRNEILLNTQMTATQNDDLASKMKAEQAQLRKQKEKTKIKYMYTGIGVGVLVIISGAIALLKFNAASANNS